MDTDKSGKCVLHEFKDACLKLGYTDVDEIVKLFGLLDVEKNDQLDFEKVNFLQCWEEEKKQDEFRQRLPTRWANKDPYMYVGESYSKQTAAPKFESSRRKQSKDLDMFTMTKEQEDELRRIFQMCDKGDGIGGALNHTIGMEELERAAKLNKDIATFLNLHSRQSVEKFFRNVDSDESGEVTWEEFKAYYFRQRLQQSPPKSAPADIGSPGKSPPPKSQQSSPTLNRAVSTAKLSLGNESSFGLGMPLEDWSAPATQDHKEQFRHFQLFLETKFGTLSKAFDTMDSNDSGSLSMVEFQSVVGTLRYILPSGQVCRASDAKRLFQTAVPDGGSITWKDFGISPQEWIEHSHFKRRLAMMKKETSSERQHMAHSSHMRRIRNPVPKTDVAFWHPLPKGWGFPPDFHPADCYFKSGGDGKADSAR